MLYKYIVLLVGFEEDLYAPLPSNVNLCDGWSLTRVNNLNLGKSANYFKKTVNDFQLDAIKKAEFALVKNISINNDAPNAVHSNSAIEQAKVDSLWLRVALRLIHPSRFVGHSLIVRISGPKKQPVGAYAVHDLYFLPPGFTLNECCYARGDLPKMRLYSKFILDLSKKYTSQHNRILNSVNLFNESCRQHRYDIRLLFLTMSLESIYSYSNHGVAEQIASGASNFTEKNPRKRPNIYSNLKELYNVRSRIVHGDKQKQSMYKDVQKQDQILRDAHFIYCKSIEKIIRLNCEAIFSSKESLKKAMEDLKLGIRNSIF